MKSVLRYSSLFFFSPRGQITQIVLHRNSPGRLQLVRLLCYPGIWKQKFMRLNLIYRGLRRVFNLSNVHLQNGSKITVTHVFEIGILKNT